MSVKVANSVVDSALKVEGAKPSFTEALHTTSHVNNADKQYFIEEYARLALALHNHDPEVTSADLAKHVASMEGPWISEGQKLARRIKEQQG